MKTLETIFSVVCIGCYHSIYAISGLLLPKNIPDVPDVEENLSYSQAIREDWQQEMSSLDSYKDKLCFSLVILRESLLFRLDATSVLLHNLHNYEIVFKTPFVIKHKPSCHHKSKYHT